MACIDENGNLFNLVINSRIVNDTGKLPVKVCEFNVLLSDLKLYNINHTNQLIKYTLDGHEEYVIDDFNENFATVNNKKYRYNRYQQILIHIIPFVITNYSHYYPYYVTDDNTLAYGFRHTQKNLFIPVDKILHVVHNYGGMSIIFCIANSKLLIVTDPCDNKDKFGVINCDIASESIAKFSYKYILDIFGVAYLFQNNVLYRLNNNFFCSDIYYSFETGVLLQDDKNNVYNSKFIIIKRNARFENIGFTCKSARKIV
jgi:hypothetical protein